MSGKELQKALKASIKAAPKKKTAPRKSEQPAALTRDAFANRLTVQGYRMHSKAESKGATGAKAVFESFRNGEKIIILMTQYIAGKETFCKVFHEAIDK